MSITEFAPAKINLTLKITGRRDDSYHLLDSLVVFADVGDVVTLKQKDAGDNTLAIAGPFAENLRGDQNLVLRAVKATQEAFNLSVPVHAILEKNLPVASGIGGGSADAAATLRAMQRLFDLPKNDPRWQKIALLLGADVPMCLHSEPVRVTGIGDILEPADIPPLDLVLVSPLVPLATKDVFALYSPFPICASIEKRNDLTAAAISLCPMIADILNAIRDQQGSEFSSMSGSGATCFGVFNSDTAATLAATALRSAYPNGWIVTTTTSVRKSRPSP